STNNSPERSLTMSFLFSVFVLPFVLLGMLVSAKNIYLKLRKHPRLAKNAGLATVIFTGLSAALISAPHFLTGAFGIFHYVLAAVYVTYICVGLYKTYQWARLILILEDGDPTNDPTFPGEKSGKDADCGCPGKKDGAAAPTDKPESK